MNITAADVTVLERVVRRAGLALRLTDLATGRPVRDGITVTAWPAGASPRPDLAAVTASVTAAGVAGFHHLSGLRTYEDGSTTRADWFDVPPAHPPLPFAVRIDDTTGQHLRVVREVTAPGAAPVDVALPRSPTATPPPGSLTVTATVVTEAGDAASGAVVEVAIGTGSPGAILTGGVTDGRGVVVIPVPRSLPPSDVGSPTTEPSWSVTIRVRFRPGDQAAAAGAAPDDPPTITSLLAQPYALVDDDGALVADLDRSLTTGAPLVVTSSPLPATPDNPSVLVVRPTP